MKLTVAFRDKPKGGFSGAKYHFVSFHVEFSKEERAIVQERGLYDHFVSVPSDTPPPTRGGDFLAMIMRIIGIIFVPVGLIISMVGSANLAFLMIVTGIVLFVIGKIKDRTAYKREANPEQRITFRRMLTNPDCVAYADTLAEAKGMEAEVRDSLSVAAETLRASTAVPDQTSYEL